MLPLPQNASGGKNQRLSKWPTPVCGAVMTSGFLTTKKNALQCQQCGSIGARSGVPAIRLDTARNTCRLTFRLSARPLGRPLEPGVSRPVDERDE